MINLIKDFIETYKQVYKERLTAKSYLKIIHNKHKEFKNVYKICNNIENDLNDVYLYCPIEQRQDFIQATLDFFNGWTKKIKCLVNTIEQYYSDCYDLYKKREYSLMENKYKELNYYISEQLWGDKYLYKNLLKEYNRITSKE